MTSMLDLSEEVAPLDHQFFYHSDLNTLTLTVFLISFRYTVLRMRSLMEGHSMKLRHYYACALTCESRAQSPRVTVNNNKKLIINYYYYYYY